MEKISVKDKFKLFNDYWSPKIVSDFNENYIKFAKLKGEFVWHHHENEDEVFFIVQGVLDIEFRDQTITLEEGELLVIPKGVEHRPVAQEEVHVILFEPKTVVNTGNVTDSEKRKEELERI